MQNYGRTFLKVGVIAGAIASILIIFPTGDLHGKYVAHNQPPAMAGMEGVFKTEPGTGIVLIGQPNEETGQIDNPIVVNDMLSFLIYGTTKAEVKGLDQIPHDQWPTALPLLYYAYHIMAGLGTYFVFVMVLSAFLLWRKKLYTARWIQWALLLSFPLPYIANTAGWMTAEQGRQPWLVLWPDAYQRGVLEHGLGQQRALHADRFYGTLYRAGLLFTVLIYREISNGPEAKPALAVAAHAN